MKHTIGHIAAMAALICLAGPAAGAVGDRGEAVLSEQPEGGGKPRPGGSAAGPTLAVGDAAPPLSIAKWVSGEPHPRLESGRVYVVEFWATWCGPCRKSVPHLSELQKRFGERVSIIGIASLEQDGVADVEKFIQQCAEKPSYSIAWDDNGQSNQAWMEASGQEFIPIAFVVEQSGKIAWIGHPMDGLDQALTSVLDGSFDLPKAVSAAKRKAQVAAQIKPLRRSLDAQMRAGQIDDALRTLDRMIELDADYAYVKFITLATGANDYKRAYAYASESIDGVLSQNAPMLTALAWAIVENPALQQRDLEVAKRAAERANVLADGKSASALAALARLAAEAGEMDRAVELQSKAVAIESNKTIQADLESRLKDYRQKQGKPAAK